MTTAITEFMPHVSPEVIGCPQIMVKDKIIQAAIELCEKAPIWQYEHADITTVAGTREYALVPPTGSLVADIIDIEYEDEDLSPTSVMDLKGIYANWRDESDTPLRYLRLIPTEISLVPNPSAVGTVSLFVSLKPLPTVTALEDFLFTEHFKTIASGAKYYLMSMPNQKWSNPNMASYYKGQFYGGIGDASVKVAGGNVGAPLRVKPCV